MNPRDPVDPVDPVDPKRGAMLDYLLDERGFSWEDALRTVDDGEPVIGLVGGEQVVWWPLLQRFGHPRRLKLARAA